MGEKEEKDEELKQKEKSNLEGHNEEQSPQRQEEDQKGDECGTYGEDSDTDGDTSILRWLQGLRRETVGGKGHENGELEVVDEEDKKKANARGEEKCPWPYRATPVPRNGSDGGGEGGDG